MEKPISLLINEARKNLIDTINKQGLPLSLMELIVKDVYLDLKATSDMQTKKEISEYNNSRQEHQDDEDNDKKTV